MFTGSKITLLEQTSSVSEFSRALDILTERNGGRYGTGPHHWATSDQLLMTTGGSFPARVTALSPSAQSVTDAITQIRKFMPVEGADFRRYPNVRPNDCSVALLVTFPALSILLGGDLERGHDEMRGWRAVVASTTRPPHKSAVYKVAHHGAENADIESIWTELLESPARAVLAPYASGSQFRPSPDDVIRLKSRTDEVYCTAWPIAATLPKRLGIDAQMNGATRSRRAVRNIPGHIRLRKSLLGGEASISLRYGAARL